MRPASENLRVGIVAAFLLAVVTAADFLSGPDLSLGILFLIPVLVCARARARWERLAVCLASGGMWLALDWLGDRHSVDLLIHFGNGIFRIGIFVVASELMAHIFRQNDALAERVALLELSFDAIIVRDKEDRIVYWNKGAEEMYGWSREEAYGKVTHQLFGTSFPEPLEKIKKKLSEAGRWSGELVHKRRDGEQLTVATRWASRTDKSGRTVAVLETNSDITEYERTHETLQQQTQVLQSILNSMGDGVIVVAADGQIVLQNPEAERLLQMGKERLMLKDWLRRHAPCSADGAADPSEREHPLIRVLNGETVGPSEFLIQREGLPDGFWVEARARPLPSDSQGIRGAVILFTDITARRRLERQVAEISELEQRRIGQDLHDGVCQHLVSTGYASNMLAESLAEKSAPEAAQASEICQLINDAVIQVRNLARALHPADLTGDGLGSALEELAHRIQVATGIRCRCAAEELASVRDQQVGIHLYRIAQEALNNAVRHSHAGSIDIELKGEIDNNLVLKIMDDGVGLKLGPVARKGMGLETMNHRARLIGATLYVGPAPKKGTLVSCSLREQAVVAE